MPTVKTCTRCGEAFLARYRHIRCPPCATIFNAGPEYRAQRYNTWLRYAAKPDTQMKVKARNKIKHLVRAGKVERGPCEGCGETKTEAHHDDYSKPLEVRWLCRKCHASHHREIELAAAQSIRASV